MVTAGVRCGGCDIMKVREEEKLGLGFLIL